MWGPAGGPDGGGGRKYPHRHSDVVNSRGGGVVSSRRLLSLVRFLVVPFLLGLILKKCGEYLFRHKSEGDVQICALASM